MGIIAQIHNNLIRKKYSATELVTGYLKHLQSRNSQINAYITVCEKEAIALAEKTDKKLAAGEKISPLEGIPFAVKDNIITKGIRTTCASKMLENYVPVYNSCVCDLLESAGAVMLGKTNMDEFGMGSSSENSFFQAVCNPHKLLYSAGGSSGGSAAAVADNLAVFALGSDTGGSVRQPASFCGVLGLKPTYGVVSRYGLIAYASGLDTIGIFARDAIDAEIVFDCIAKKDNRDSTSVEFAPTNLEGNLKIGFVPGTELPEILTNEAEIKNIHIKTASAASGAYIAIASAEAASNLARYDGVRYGFKAADYANREEMIAKTRTEGFGREVKKRILLGNLVLSEEYRKEYYDKAVAVRKAVIKELEEIFKIVDVIACPVTMSGAFRLGEKRGRVDLENEVYLQIASLAGLPALSVPVGCKDGMPVGLQLIGKRFSEKLLLRLAEKIQTEPKKEATDYV